MSDTLKREDQIDERADGLFSHPDHNELKELEKKAVANHAEATALAQENDSSGFVSNVTGKSAASGRFSRIKGLTKKSGPLGIIGLVSIAGLFGIGLLTPGLAVVQIKEMFSEDLNDQLGAMDVRTTHVMKAKLNDMSKGTLCGPITAAKCKFKGMSERQIAKFKAAGIDVQTKGSKNKLTGRTNIERMVFSDGTVIDNPTQARRLLTTNQTVRTELRRAFNPKFAGLYDAVSAKVFAKYNTSKSSKVTGTTDEERNTNIEKSIQEGTGSIDDPTLLSNDDEDNSENKNRDDEAKKQTEKIRELAGDGGKGFSKVSSSIGGGVRGVGALGTADSVCTLKNTARASAAAAKVIRKKQLIGFAMVFLNFADEVKAGTATPDQAEFIGNKLTSVDTQEMIFNENSEVKSTTSAEKVKNPDFGKNAFDSEGYRASAYNDAPSLSARANQFSVGGLSGSLATTINTLVSKAPSDTACKYVQNSIVRAGSLIVGIGLGIASGGATLVASIGASVAISAALPYLQAYLADMLAGKVINKDTQGVDAGNAVFAGTSSLLGDVAVGRGMKPATKADLQSYQALSNTIKNEYIAMESNDAKSTPFDMYNQYSFIGSLSRKILPASIATSSSIATLPSSGLNILSAATQSIFPTTSAVGDWNPERYSKCEDEAYKKIKIDADVFCNVRYTMSDKELAMETDDVIDFMTNNPEYLSEDGTPGSEYQKWLEECTERTVGWGESPEGDSNGTGEICMTNSTKYSNFRVYTMDKSINDAMEYEGQSTETGGINIGTYNVLSVDADGKAKDSVDQRAQFAAENIKKMDIVGLQEADQVGGKDSQVSKIHANLPGYGISSAATRTILWNTSKFTLVKSDEFGIDKQSLGGRKNQMLWVKLKTTSGAEFYVIDIHADVDSPPNRAQNAKDVLNLMKEKMDDGLPVIIVGDMNSGDQFATNKSGRAIGKDINTVFMESGLLSYTYEDAANKVNADFKSYNGLDEQESVKESKAVHIDQIYITTASNPVVNSWENIINENTSRASDHNPVVVNVSIPGISGDSTGAGGSASVTTDGYAFPVALSGLTSGITLNQTKSTHWGGYSGFDLMSKDNTPVYAITDGDITKVNRSYTFDGGAGKPCEAITFKSKDGYYYWYGHVINSTTKTSGIKAGEKIAEVAGKSYGALCNGGGPHLHIDRNKSLSLAGNKGDPSFIPQLSKIYEAAGGK